jgi:hypothetical protein
MFLVLAFVIRGNPATQAMAEIFHSFGNPVNVFHSHFNTPLTGAQGVLER